jgi:hypothetical protein
MRKLSGLSSSTHSIKDFFYESCALIHSFVSRGSVAIKFNDNIGNYFETKKRL